MGNPIRFSAGESGGGWSPLPEGTYDFRIVEIEQGVSSNNNPQLKVRMEVLDGPRAGEKCNTWYSLLPQSGWKLRGLVEALDIPHQIEGQDAQGNDILVFDADELLQRCVRMAVTQREYNNKMTNDFKNESLSIYDPMSQQQSAPQAAPAQQQQQPAPQAQPQHPQDQQQAQPSMRRRPRPGN